MLDFYVSRSKRECINYLKEYYPRDSQGKKIDWNKYKSKKIKAIYIDYRKMYG